MSEIRDTRLLDKSTFDFPDENCEAGSSSEADIIAEWSRWELVEKIQELDGELFRTQKKLEAAELGLNDARIHISKAIENLRWFNEDGCIDYLDTAINHDLREALKTIESYRDGASDE